MSLLLKGGAARRRVRVYKLASQDMGSGSVTPIVFDTTDYDDDGMHNPAVNPTRLTIKVAGLYIVHGQIWWQASSTVGYRRITIRANGSTTLAENRQLGTTGAAGDLRHSVTTQYVFAVGEYVELVVVQTSGSPLRAVEGTSQSPLFSAVLIG